MTKDSPSAWGGWRPTVYLLPTEPYLGLTLQAAAALATQEGCELANRTGQSVRTLELRPHRVKVELDEAGLVVAAHRG